MKRLFILWVAGYCAACSSSNHPGIEDAIEAESNALAPTMEIEPVFAVDDTSFILNDTMKIAPADTLMYPE